MSTQAPTLEDVQSWPAAVDVRHAAAALNISPSWAYQLITQGEFPCRVIKVGKRHRVATASLVRLLETGEA